MNEEKDKQTAETETAPEQSPETEVEEKAEKKHEKKEKKLGRKKDEERAALEAEKEALEREKAALNDKYLRLCAEYDNFRRRSQKEKDGLYGDIKADTVQKFLPVYDNLERALKQGTEDGAYRKGVEMIMTQFNTTLEKLGVKKIESLGKTFDPNLQRRHACGRSRAGRKRHCGRVSGRLHDRRKGDPLRHGQGGKLVRRGDS